VYFDLFLSILDMASNYRLWNH